MMRNLTVLLLLLVSFASCSKKDDYDAAKQAAIDDQLIRDYLKANNLTANHDDTGIYYIITALGSGAVSYNRNTQISAKYTGRLLNGDVFDQSESPVPFSLGQVIPGWQYGIPKIKPGGKIRLFVPSGLAYLNRSMPGIPANSVLDFDVELVAAFNQ